MLAPEKPRYEYVDLMKGICIMLVIIHHLVGKSPISPLYLTMFRMPLYFLLSGLFFSTYGSFREFLIKKFNTLLVPFIFTWLVVRVHTGLHFGDWQMDVINYNVSIWFLMVLFQVGLVVYLITLLPREWMRLGIALALSLVGYVLWHRFTLPPWWNTVPGLSAMNHVLQQRITLPFWWDAVLSSTIFYYLGIQARRLRLLEARARKWDVLFLVLCLLVFGILAYYFPKMFLDLRTNRINASYPVLLIAALSGTGIVFFLSKLIRYVPLISYYGRYSIIALCAHIFLFRLLNEYGVLRFIQQTLNISNQVWVREKVGAWTGVILVIVLTLPLVWLLVRHIPFLVSQMPLLNPKTGKLYKSPRTLLRIFLRGKDKE